MKDKLGQEIVEGDIIAYGHALGRCAGLRIGKVLAIKPTNPDAMFSGNCRITVIGVDDDWAHNELALCRKKGTLMFSERIIVLPRARVPGKYRVLLGDHHEA